MANVQIFLSTVSAEFRSYRDALRRDLDRPNVTVKVQEDFIATGTETLDEAQAAKKRLIATKLLLRPGMRVLDIGCGWGGMALTLARDHGVHVTGITLSAEQLSAARTRAADADDRDPGTKLVDFRTDEIDAHSINPQIANALNCRRESCTNRLPVPSEKWSEVEKR